MIADVEYYSHEYSLPYTTRISQKVSERRSGKLLQQTQGSRRGFPCQLVGKGFKKFTDKAIRTPENRFR